MCVDYILIILCCSVLSSKCQHLNKTVCEGSSCYYLYEADVNFLTWDHSRNVCIKYGLEVSRIESNQTQNVIERLLQDLPQSTPRQIWIGGRRSTDDKWIYMNGSEFNKNFTAPHQTASYCSYVQICKGFASIYRNDNCDEKTGSSRILCQYDQSKTDSCSSSDVHFGDKCYRKTKYDGHEPNKIDWFNGETYCRQSDIQGDIAYSYLDNDTLINNVINLVDGSKDCLQLWFGVRKRIWFWMTGSNRDQDKQPINYFNWDNNIEIDSSDDDCIYIDRDKGNKWFTQNCTGPPLKYFICMNGSSGTMKTTTTSRTTLTTTSTTTTLASLTSKTDDITETGISTIGNADKATTAAAAAATATITDTKDPNSLEDEDNKIKFKLIYIVPIIVVIVLPIVIGLAVFFVVKKRQKSNNEQRYVNEEFHRPSAEQAKNDDPEYADVEPPNDQDDMIDPYGVTGNKNTRNDDVGHKEAPSGDLYAVSSKQTSKTDDDINKNKDGINPEELYAKPNKKRNQKSKMDKVNEENQATNSRNDVDTESPSSDEKSSGSKHTEHFETETGDVYAKVTK